MPQDDYNHPFLARVFDSFDHQAEQARQRAMVELIKSHGLRTASAAIRAMTDEELDRIRATMRAVNAELDKVVTFKR